jgi:penicillin amidase
VVPGRRRWRLIRQISNGVAAACVAAAVLGLCAAGVGGVPPVGVALDPGHGAWASAAGGLLPKPEVLAAPGLAGPALVSFDPHGIATVQSGQLPDAMLALGYLHARFRLTQMDLQRRLAEGRLSQLVGASGLASDRFELRLGLLRTAEREWAAMPRGSVAARMLTAYSRGVNDYVAELRASGQWPAEFSLAGVYPRRWSPVDSLAVQGYLAQEVDYTSTPLDYAVLAGALGIGRTMRWLPVQPPGAVRAFDPGPYRPRGAAPLVPGSAPQPSAAVVRSAAAALSLTSELARGPAGGQPIGSAWAANGPKVKGGGSLLAGTAAAPGLFPSGWFQVSVTAPGYDVSGVSLPGLPGIVIGHNKHVAWTLAGTQSQSTLFYAEKLSRSRGEYLWRGRWRPVRRIRYAIPVRGGPARRLTVDLTAHGPLLGPQLTEPGAAGPPISVAWTGSGGSPDVAVLARIGAAANFTQFHAALARWRSPALTFVYADRRGNIGAVTAGSFPVVRQGAPWLPLPGTGAGDVVGLIPYAALPVSYDPPGHVVAVAGQRPVTAAYPYYLGTAANDLDAADVAGADYAVLARTSGIQPAGVVPLQTSPVSELSARVVPRLLAALQHASLSPGEQHARSALRGWNHQMAPGSGAAAVWVTFWQDYLAATFGPWWRAASVPVRTDPAGLQVSAAQAGLARTLEHWTVADRSNPVFAPPGAPAGTATSAMRTAFRTAVARLTAQFRGGPSAWRLDQVTASPVVSSAEVPVLGYGRRAVVTSPWLAAGLVADAGSAGLPAAYGGGASNWRMIVWLSPGAGGTMAEGIYRGGQSDNPASPWFANLTTRWQAGGYLVLPPAGKPVTGTMRWELLP